MSYGAKADFVFMLCPFQFSWPSCLTFKDFRCFILMLVSCCTNANTLRFINTPNYQQKLELILNLVHTKIRWLIQIHVKQTGLSTRQFDWCSVRRLIRSGVPNAQVCKKLHYFQRKWQWMALKNEISKRKSWLFSIIVKNRLHSLLPIAREGNIFRSVCPWRGVCLQRKSLPTKGKFASEWVSASREEGVCLHGVCPDPSSTHI